MTSVKSAERDMDQLRSPADTGPWEDTSPALAVDAAGKSDRGRVRGSNEDQFLVAELAKLLRIEQSTLPEPGTQLGNVHGHLFLVADGMGGHAGGEIASRIAASTIEECLLNSLKWFLRPQGEEGREVVEHLQGAVVEADARVLRAAKGRPELKGMGSTLTLALAVGRSLFIAHVGDSRAYLLRDGKLYRLTKDHTLINDLTARGDLLPGQDVSPRLRHVITNAIGGSDAGVRVEVLRAGLEPGDRLLLCTDGLTDLLDDEAITSMLAAHPKSATACEQLVDEANERGGHDNITAVVAAFTAPLAA
jgi:serine/threonine protein phosphatase PrpC